MANYIPIPLRMRESRLEKYNEDVKNLGHISAIVSYRNDLARLHKQFNPKSFIKFWSMADFRGSDD